MNIEQKNIKCDCGNNTFSINLNKVESVGLVTCQKCERNYFLLDSGDYWYDTIQEKYPPKVRCNKCKSEFFDLRLSYEFREDSKDIKYIEITGLCKQCGFLKKLGTWEIDYSPTDSLIKTPLVFCSNPKIQYDLSNNTCYWTVQDLVKLIEFLYSLDLSIYSQFHKNNKLTIEELEKAETIKQAASLKYYKFFAGKKKLLIDKEKGIDWKREEVIYISSPLNMTLGGVGEKVGLLFYIEYSLNYIDDFKSGTVKEKSVDFKKIVRKIEDWLKTNYKSFRGKNTFDDFQEHKRLFGDRFLKKEFAVKEQNQL